MSQQVYLECINPGGSEYKYWRGWIDRTTCTLHTNWGRIDAPKGQSKSYPFSQLSHAEAKLESLVRSKLRKGYEDKSATAGLAPTPTVAPPDPATIAYTVRLLLSNLRPLLNTASGHPSVESILADAGQMMPELAPQIRGIRTREDLDAFLEQID